MTRENSTCLRFGRSGVLVAGALLFVGRCCLAATGGEVVASDGAGAIDLGSIQETDDGEAIVFNSIRVAGLCKRISIALTSSDRSHFSEEVTDAISRQRFDVQLGDAGGDATCESKEVSYFSIGVSSAADQLAGERVAAALVGLRAGSAGNSGGVKFEGEILQRGPLKTCLDSASWRINSMWDWTPITTGVGVRKYAAIVRGCPGAENGEMHLVLEAIDNGDRVVISQNRSGIYGFDVVK